MLQWKPLILTLIFLSLKATNFDIVIPLFNASKRIVSVLDALQERATVYSFRVILVDDFSADDTFQKVSEIQQNYSFEIELIQLAKNGGQHNATMVGLSRVQGDFAITMDDDLQHHPSQFEKIIEEYQHSNSDLIYGVYKQKKHSFTRNVGSALLKMIVRMSNPRLVNITSFRLVKSEVLKSFDKTNKPIVFLDEYLINLARNTSFVKVEHSKREEGKSSYSYGKLIAFAINIILFHSSVPLKFITRIGLIMSLTFFGIGCYFIWQKLFNDVQIGFTSIIVSIFFSSGLTLFALGIIGEYIRKIWTSQNQLNTIVIRKQILFEKE